MTKEKMAMYLMAKSKFFPAKSLPMLKSRLEQAEDGVMMTIESLELKDPTTLLIVSLLAGGLGIDRFMLGDVGMGVLKLLTGGLCGILTIVDWCTIMNKTRRDNLAKVMAIL